MQFCFHFFYFSTIKPTKTHKYKQISKIDVHSSGTIFFVQNTFDSIESKWNKDGKYMSIALEIIKFIIVASQCEKRIYLNAK